MPEECSVVDESVSLPSFSLDTSNSISTFSVRISHKTLSSEKFNNFSNESARSNLLLKVPLRSSLLPQTLPNYYYTSTFPSFFSAFLAKNPPDRSPEQHKNMQLGISANHGETDDTKPIMPCLSSQNIKIQEHLACKENNIYAVGTKTRRLETPDASSQENALRKAEKKLLKSEKKDKIPLAAFDGEQNRSMSLSNPKCFTRDESFLKRRRRSAVTHISISNPNYSHYNRKSRAVTSMAPNSKSQFCPIVRPNTCETARSYNRRGGPSTTRSEKQQKFILKKNEKEKFSKKDLNSCFERYYAAQLQANKARINRKKVFHGNFLPKQTYWNHSNQTTMCHKRIEPENRSSFKIKGSSGDKIKCLNKLNDLKIASDSDKTSNFTESEQRKNVYESPKFSSLSKQDQHLLSLRNKTTQTSMLTISRLSDKPELESQKSSKKFRYYTPTPLLSPEQIVMRDSVDKVRRWIETLPKHFDAIQQVSSPTQQDY